MTDLDSLIERWQDEESASIDSVMPGVLSRLDLIFPNSLRVHRHEEFDDEVIDWALRTGIYDASTAAELRALQCGWVVRMCTPGLSRQQRLPVAMYFAWITAVDDGMADHGKSLQNLKESATRTLLGHGGGEQTPTVAAMTDLRSSLQSLGREGFIPEFAALVSENIEAYQRKQQHIREGVLPEPAGYLSMRSVDGSTHPMIALSQCFRSSGPTSPETSALLRDIAAQSAQLAAIENDVAGFPADLARPEPGNLVFSIAQHCPISLTTALHVALGMIEGLKNNLDRLISTLEKTPDVADSVISQAQAAVSWVDGMHVWTTSAPRYVEPVAAKKHTVRSIE